jgi:tetratricopeptide (TPR) repeat protein
MKPQSIDQRPKPHVGYNLLGCVALIVAGLVVGWPALDGGFLGSDDEHLIVNHALVNHPSLANAIELFTISHRDLYQPIPLLTFQIEFALFSGGGLDALAAAMHRTNLAIHILNGLLVWVLFRRLAGGRLVPLMIALLFVVHPLSVECFAWLNGRMIMLSTTFSLASLIVFNQWQELRTRPRGGTPANAFGVRDALLIAGVLCFAVLAMMSKVRPGLPFLFGVVLLWRRGWPDRKTWVVMLTALALAVCFIVVNYGMTKDSRMFEGADRQLQGPNLARVAMSLEWYFTHYIWPAGLSPYYPTPPTVAWGDRAVLIALAVVFAVAVATLLSWRKSRVGLVGMMWFLLTVGATLPFIPARNLLVADRYVYMSNIGLNWIFAAAALLLFNKLSRARRLQLGRLVVGLLAVGVPVLLIGASRQLTDHYADNDASIARIIDLSPEHPTLRTTWGWYHFQRGDYVGARSLADQELAMFPDDNVAFARAMNLRAMSRYSQEQDVPGAERDLRNAIERYPEFAKSHFRLGLIYYEQHRLAEAAQQLEIAIEKAPEFNPALNLLGRVCRRTDQLERARRLYERSLANSRGYDVEALEALAEMELEAGSFEQAAAHYEALLALRPGGVPARMNLAFALRSVGRSQDAWQLYASLLSEHPGDRRVLIAAADFLRSAGRFDMAARLWDEALRAEPRAADLLAWRSLHEWYVQDFDGAERSAQRALQAGSEPVARLTLLLIAVAADRPEEVNGRLETLFGRQEGRDLRLFTYAYEALQFLSSANDASPWPYYATALLLLEEDRYDVAQAVRADFEKRCRDEAWRARLDEVFAARKP